MQPKKPVKHSVAVVIYSKDRKRVLIVQRPYNDESLPEVWGLPASSLRNGESFEDAVLRTGNEKLGVELKVIKVINEGTIERENFLLHMKEYEVEIVKGTPKVPQEIEGITQYQNLKYGIVNDLIPAAQGGSLCSRLYLSLKKVQY
jgi:8-oxo-dGTP pyrophosphatase MutT (NUDIX family)